LRTGESITDLSQLSFLHFADVEKLIEVLNRLASTGNTVLDDEHNLDIIKTADWLIGMVVVGGLVVAEGTPEPVAQVPESYTAKYLRRVLGMV